MGKPFLLARRRFLIVNGRFLIVRSRFLVTGKPQGTVKAALRYAAREPSLLRLSISTSVVRFKPRRRAA
jgi:hypothetical protein